MDLHIFDLFSAVDFLPTKPTYAIRIFLPSQKGDRFYEGSFQYSSFYVAKNNYYFNDIFPNRRERKNEILFDESIARKMLEDFLDYKEECGALLVHCSRGVNRSPAVAITFNDIFYLGHDSNNLKCEYKYANWHVYDTLKKVAKEMKI